MVSRNVKLAVIGYGNIAAKHLEAFRDLGVTVEAVCDAFSAARERARKDGIAKTCETIAETMEKTRPDAILCTVSFGQNTKVARELLPYGIPVLLEKPPALSMAELHELIELADKHQTPAMVAFNRRHYSVFRKALEMAGGLENVTGAFAEWGEEPKFLRDKLGFSPEEVKLAVYDNSIHGIDFMAYAAGALVDPQVLTIGDPQDPTTWRMTLQGKTEKNALAVFHSTWDSPARWRFSFTSPGKRFVFAPLETGAVQHEGSRQLIPIEPDPIDDQFKPGFHQQAAFFLSVMEQKLMRHEHDLRAAIPSMQLAAMLTDSLQGK